MPWVATMADLADRLPAAAPLLQLERDELAVRRDVGAAEVESAPREVIQGVKSVPYGAADAFCTFTVAPLWAIIRLPNSVGCSSPETLIGSSELLVTGRT